MTLDNLQVSSAAITDKGLSEKRPQNEDSYLELRDSGLYAVADGVGGAQAGDVASQMAMEILGEAFINLQEDGDAEERMQAAISQANGAIYQMANELAQLSTMATTIVAIHINGNIATIGHVGDSRLYRLDEKGNLYRETQDHSVVEEEVRAGRMTPEQALTHPSRNVISRALGAEQTVEIDMKTIMFETNTKFLVCSDGVTRHIPDEELRSILIDENDDFSICQTIKSLCYERGAQDNLTAVVVSIGGASSDEYVSETAERDQLNTSDTLRDFEEEDTIATARPALANTAGSGTPMLEADESQSELLEIPEHYEAEEDFETPPENIGNGIVIPTNSESENVDSISIAKDENFSDQDDKPVIAEDIRSYQVEDNGGTGIFGRIVSGLVWLLIGAVIGALGFYFWTNYNASLVGENDQQTQTSVLTPEIFEQNKRLAVTDPAKYITDNPNSNTAYESYLLGLAFIANENYEDAKKELEKAQNSLSAIAENDRKVLENDISLAMSKINSGGNKEAEKSATANDKKISATKALEKAEPNAEKTTTSSP